MTDKIIVTPAMVRDAYSGQAGSGNRITNVTADYIAKGLTAALNPPEWTVYSPPFGVNTWGVESQTSKVHIRLYNAADVGGGIGFSMPISKERAQELADIMNKAEFSVD